MLTVAGRRASQNGLWWGPRARCAGSAQRPGNPVGSRRGQTDRCGECGHDFHDRAVGIGQRGIQNTIDRAEGGRRQAIGGGVTPNRRAAGRAAEDLDAQIVDR